MPSVAAIWQYFSLCFRLIIYKTDALRFFWFLAIADCAIQHESKYFCGKILAEGVYQHMPYDAGFYWMVACLF